MRLAIMQPYLFPYLGYFQLIAAADKFVFYDDVNYIKNGWINRNQLILSKAVAYFTVPLSGMSPFSKINEVDVQPAGPWQRKMVESVRQSYARAPFFAAAFPLFESVIQSGAPKVGELARRSVVAVCDYLGLKTVLEPTSGRYQNQALSGPARVIDICKQEGASEYVNMEGGRELYDARVFEEHGVKLHFLKAVLPPYPQAGMPEFKAGLSIIDVLMFNDRDAANEMLQKYQLA